MHRGSWRHIVCSILLVII
ncbi:hypothetical protein O3G_MSEX012067, partial [Manduca sexta]